VLGFEAAVTRLVNNNSMRGVTFVPDRDLVLDAIEDAQPVLTAPIRN